MSTKHNNSEIKNYFDDIFTFKTYDDKIEHEAIMLNARIMQLTEKAMERKGWNKKILAKEIGTSASYLTQLFMDNKLVNLKMMAKIQDALDINFTMDYEGINESCYSFKRFKNPVKAPIKSAIQDSANDDNSMVA
ncbi:MAG: helix-turn-helix domain-containing protein [Bacteroidales bacterium]